MSKKIIILFSFILCVAYPNGITAGEKPITILYLGDSLTEGFGINPEDAYPALVDRKLKEAGHKNIQTINGGYSGSTTASAVSRLQWYSRVKPDILVIALGANDGLRGLSTDAMRENLAKAIEFAQSQGMKVVLCGIQAPPNYGKAYTKEFKSVFTALAQKYEITLVPFLLDGVAGVLDKNLPDGIHPNEEGHKIMSNTVFSILSPFL